MADYQRVKTELLKFDHLNPRLVEEKKLSKNTKENVIIKLLWDTMDVKELVMSINNNGYFNNDPIIIGVENNRKIVLEGNRRLAAVKLLLNPSILPKVKIPIASEGLRKEIETLPTVLMSRESAWNFIGYKHVNGPAKWTSYAKAQYIVDVHRKYGTSLDDLADQIGDKNKAVRKLYRTFLVVEQAERDTNFSRDDTFTGRLAFSHLSTALNYKGFISYLNLKSEDKNLKKYVPDAKMENWTL